MEIKSSSKRGTKPNTTSSKTKKTKNSKNHPLKVVYISNPMKVTTSASDFRALVQRLTGKGAVWPVDTSDIGSPTESEISDNQILPNSSNGNMITNNVSVTAGGEFNDQVLVNDGVVFPVADPSPESSVASDDLYFQPLDLDYDDVILIDFASLVRSDGVDLSNY